jgi:nicotinamide riboside transporter PnuC
MYMLNVISWAATGTSLLGQWLINNKKKSAFPIWITSNVLWILVNIIGTFNLANVVMYIIYTMMNIHGLYKWNKSSI